LYKRLLCCAILNNPCSYGFFWTMAATWE
jgi:hypothetical protein